MHLSSIFKEYGVDIHAYYDVQFTILRILPKNVADKEAIRVESIYKNKLCTRNPEYGLNRN